MKSGAAILMMALLAFSAFAAERVEVLTLPPSLFADTEVSTNVVVNRRRNDVKAFDVSMELAGSVSNSVQIAFGRDADGDRNLAPGETALVLGWRTNHWFVVRAGVGRGCAAIPPHVRADGRQVRPDARRVHERDRRVLRRSFASRADVSLRP